MNSEWVSYVKQKFKSKYSSQLEKQGHISKGSVKRNELTRYYL